MFRSLVLFGLASSLLAFSQTPAGVTVNGGYATTTAPGAPILTPPNAALPGSGPATGQPPAVGVNDPRYGGQGSVYQPSPAGSVNALPSSPEAAVGSLPTTSSESANGSAPASGFSAGVGSYSEAPSNAPEVSLADIARQYKAQRASAHPRQFDNSNIRHASYGTADTNSAALPQSDQASATYGSTGTMEVPEGVKNAADYAAVQAALARSQATTNANASQSNVNGNMPDPNRSSDTNQPQAQTSEQQQSATPAPQASSAQDATTPQVEQSAASTTSTPAKKQLPASASSLPLIGLLGLIALSAGGIFTYRVRRAEA